VGPSGQRQFRVDAQYRNLHVRILAR
jgi:hypothetical protein